MGAWEYYVRLMKTARDKTKEVAGYKTSIVIYTLASISIGLFCFSQWASKEEVSTKVIEVIAFVFVGGIVTAFLAYLFIFFAIAPYHVHVEDETAHKEEMRRAA